MTSDQIIAILAAAIVAGTPLLYAALGEIITERAGIINLGVEGMMLVGAVSGFTVAVGTGNPWFGVMAAAAAGGAMASIHAFLTISLRANQVVSGLALTIFGTGLSGFLGKPMVGIVAPKTLAIINVPALSSIPWLGPIFFRQDGLVYLSYLIVPLLWFYFYRTRGGLNMRAIGENPAAADSVGINVFLLRYAYTVIGGAFAGVAGAYLSLAYAPTWLENMTAGRGWIAVALVIFAMWDPVKAMLGSYLFGGIDAMGFRLQAMGINVISPFFLKMLPYIFTVIVLIIATRQSLKKHIGAPGSLGLPYDREER